eukprot:2298459-Amphidinium_carterae.1
MMLAICSTAHTSSYQWCGMQESSFCVNSAVNPHMQRCHIYTTQDTHVLHFLDCKNLSRASKRSCARNAQSGSVLRISIHVQAC